MTAWRSRLTTSPDEELMEDPYAEKIASHQANNLLLELSTAIDTAVANPDLAPQHALRMRRAQAVVDRLKARLQQIEAIFIPVPALDKLAAPLQNAQQAIQAFLSDNNEGHLSTLDGSIDALLMEANFFPALRPSAERKMAARAAEDYARHLHELESAVRDRLGELITQMQAQSDEFHTTVGATAEQLQQLQKAADEKSAALAADIESRTTQLKADSESRMAELKAEIDGQKTRLDTVITQQQTAFAEAQERRVHESKDSLSSVETKFEQLAGALVDDTKSKLDQLLAQATASVQSLEKQEQRAAEIVGVTAAAGVTGSHTKEADEQRLQADMWRWIAIGVALLVTMYAGAVALITPPSADMSAADIAAYAFTRGPFGLLIGLLIPYAMRQSGHHRRREQLARRRAMELTAFRPFLAELPEEERNAQIIEGSKRFFPGDTMPPSEE